MLDILREIHEILVKHGHTGQAETVAQLIALYGTEPELFAQHVRGIEMWGGSGAVWEVGVLGEDTRRFWSAIARLSDEMDRAGIGLPRARSTADIFRWWIERGADVIQ